MVEEAKKSQEDLKFIKQLRLEEKRKEEVESLRKDISK